MLSGESDEDLQHVWLEGGREAFARTIADKQSLAAAEAKTEARTTAFFLCCSVLWTSFHADWPEAVRDASTESRSLLVHCICHILPSNVGRFDML